MVKIIPEMPIIASIKVYFDVNKGEVVVKQVIKTNRCKACLLFSPHIFQDQ